MQDTLKWVKPNESVDLLFIDDQPSDIQLSASVELEVTHTDPGVKGDTASGGGNKPATLETGVTVNVPLFVNIGDRIKVDTRSGSYMSRAWSEQRRAAVFALYQHDVTGRPLDDMFKSTDGSFTKHSPTRPLTTRPSSTSTSPATPRAGRSTASPRSKAILRTALLEMLHPELVEGDRDPGRGRDRRGGRDRGLLRRRRPRLRQRHPRRGPPRGAPEWRRACRLKPRRIVERLERTAAELRTGDLDPERAASAGRRDGTGGRGPGPRGARGRCPGGQLALPQ